MTQLSWLLTFPFKKYTTTEGMPCKLFNKHTTLYMYDLKKCRQSKMVYWFYILVNINMQFPAGWINAGSIPKCLMLKKKHSGRSPQAIILGQIFLYANANQSFTWSDLNTPPFLYLYYCFFSTQEKFIHGNVAEAEKQSPENSPPNLCTDNAKTISAKNS